MRTSSLAAERKSARKDGPEWMIFILMNENATFDTKTSLTTPRRGKGEKENPDSMIFILMNENVIFYETALTMACIRLVQGCERNDP